MLACGKCLSWDRSRSGASRLFDPLRGRLLLFRPSGIGSATSTQRLVRKECTASHSRDGAFCLWSCSDRRRGTAAHHDERQNSGWQICTSQVQATLWRLCYIFVHQDIRDVEGLCKDLAWAAWRPGLTVKYKIVCMRNNEMKTVLMHH